MPFDQTSHNPSPVAGQADAAEALLHQTLNALPQLAWTARPNGAIEFCNRFWLEYTGLKSSQVVGNGWTQALHPDDLDSTTTAWRAAAAAGSTYQVEQRLRGRDGQYRWFLTRASLQRDAEGRVLHWIGVCIDIDARRRAEEARLASELALQHRLAELETIYNTTPVGLCFLDAEMRYVSINDRLAKLHGVPVADHVGRQLREFKPELADVVEPYLKRVIATGEPIVDLELAYPGSEQIRFVLVTYHPVKDVEGRVLGVNVVVLDITDRKEAELRIRDSEERFRTLADNIAQLAWMADETGSLFWYNRRWFDYTGTTFEEMQGWGWQKVHHPDHLRRVTDKFRSCVQTGEFWEDTFPLRGADGAYRWFLSRAIPIRNEAGQVIRWFGTNTDITQQRKIEEALKDADRRKDHFLALLGHELRNPLAGVTSGIEVLKLIGGGDQQADEIRSAIERQALQMKHLIDDLLDVSRITSGRISLRQESVELTSLVAQVLEDQRRTLSEKQCPPTLECRVSELWVQGDRTRLAQIVNNLLHNACKFTDHNGSVTVIVDQSGQHAQIIVRDTGIGIHAELMGRLFEPFAQAESALSRNGGGLGLGLALVKGLTELHGGTVSVFSAGAGHGAEFIVHLPVTVPDDARSSNQHAALPVAARRVLLVDDLPDTLLPLQRFMQLAGHEVLVATTGAEAVSTAQYHCPDVVLCDIGLPDGMSGYDVARSLRALSQLRTTYLVAITGFGQDHDRTQARLAGFDYHVTKPVNGETLAKLLTEFPRFDAE